LFSHRDPTKHEFLRIGLRVIASIAYRVGFLLRCFAGHSQPFGMSRKYGLSIDETVRTIELHAHASYHITLYLFLYVFFKLFISANQVRRKKLSSISTISFDFRQINFRLSRSLFHQNIIWRSARLHTHVPVFAAIQVHGDLSPTKAN